MSQSKIIVPRHRIIIPRMVIRERRAPPPRFGVRLQPQHMRYEVGRYRERLRSGPGGLGRGRIWTPERVGEQHNLVLDVALDNLIVSNAWMNLIKYAVVGTGSTAPNAGDTQLAAELARSYNPAPGYSATPTESFVSDGVYRIEKGVEFSPSEVGGNNLTEWGWSPSGTTNGALVSRELFRDDNNNPITLSLASDQYLRLIYAIQITLAPLTQAITIDITNIGSINGTLRLSSEAATGGMSKAYDYTVLQYLVRGVGVNFGGMSINGPSTYDGKAWGGSITTKGLTYQNPSGRSRQSNQTTFEPSEGNHTWATLVLHTYGKYPGVYVNLDSPFTKDDQHKLIFDPWTISW